MIPKIIHYCWFGPSQIPGEYQAYIDDWRVVMPDYEFRLWNEENSPMHLPYVRNAHRNAKWANVSNFVRLHAVYNFGGIYLDTDVEVVKPFDELLSLKCFFGFETDKPVFRSAPLINNATFGATPGHPFIKEVMVRLLERFDGQEDASLSSPNLVSELLRPMGCAVYGYHDLNGVKVFPKEYFYPYYVGEDRSNAEITANTYSIHHWAKTWGRADDMSIGGRLKGVARDSVKRYLPRKAAVHLKNILKPPEQTVDNVMNSRVVLHGPFVGLRYPEGRKAFGSSFAPKIVGSYEECLHYSIASLVGNDYDEVHDIGCAEGYYLGGMSMFFPSARVIGYDISPEAVELANKLIHENHFTSTTAEVRDVTRDFWATYPKDKRTLVICDIEGAERELFDKDAVTNLVRADLIIELHDFLDGSIKPTLLSVFNGTHDLKIIQEANKDISKYSSLHGLSFRECQTLLDEGRPCKMEWLVARCRHTDS